MPESGIISENHTGGFFMEENWILKRVEAYKERLAKEEQTKTWRQDAQAKYNEFFDGLKNQIQRDLQTYNNIPHVDRQASILKDEPGMIEISCAGSDKLARVEKCAGSTIIKITWLPVHPINSDPFYKNNRPRDQRRPSVRRVVKVESDELEVAPDDKGNIRFQHKGTFLLSFNKASEIVLDPIFPK